ncbi:MAG: hypothetical protein P8Y53_01775 [Pseudolabrys sp.]
MSAALALAACAQNANHLNTHYLDRFATRKPTLTAFTVCHGFGCAERSHASLSLAEWRKVRAVFRPRAKDAKAERRQIAQAVALMERLVGPKTGTGVHQWTHKNELIYPNMGDPTQLDCVDESVNTWTYMTMMERGNAQHGGAEGKGRRLLRDRRQPGGLRQAAAGDVARDLDGLLAARSLQGRSGRQNGRTSPGARPSWA